MLQGGSRDHIFQGSDYFSLILLALSYGGSKGHAASPYSDMFPARSLATSKDTRVEKAQVMTSFQPGHQVNS